MTSTLRVHRHRAVPRLLSHCPLSFLWSTSKPFEFTRPLPRLGRGRGPRCVSSGAFYRRPWWASLLRLHAFSPTGAHTSSVGLLLVTLLPTEEVWGKWTNDLFSLSPPTLHLPPALLSLKGRVPRAHIPCDFAYAYYYSGFAVAAVGKTEAIQRATSTCPRARNVPYLERRALAPPHRAAAMRVRFSDCLAVKDMYRHTKQKRTT